MAHRRVQACFAVGILLVAPVPLARAEVVIESQSRRVDVHVEEWGHDIERDQDVLRFEGSDHAYQADAAPFDQSLRTSSGRSHGAASQVSTLSPTRFQAAGSVSVYAATDLASSAGKAGIAARLASDEPASFPRGTKTVSICVATWPMTHRRVIAGKGSNGAGGLHWTSPRDCFPPAGRTERTSE